MQNKNYTFIQLLISHSQFQKKHPECTICTIKNFIYLCSTTVQYRWPQLLLSFICIYLSTLLCNTVYLSCYSYYLYYLSVLLSSFVICIFYNFFFYIDVLFIYNVNVNRTVWVAFNFRSMCNDNKDNSDSDSDSCWWPSMLPLCLLECLN